jgi:signal transduction histidine kinase
LNNPSSAVVRGAKELAACRVALANASRALGAAGLGDAELQAVQTLEAAAQSRRPEFAPLERADRDDAVNAWLERVGLDEGFADPLAESGLTIEQLEQAARTIAPQRLAVAIAFVAASANAARLTGDLELASSRIQSLVAAVKAFTHRDRAPVVEPVRIPDGLADTLTLVRAKARSKQVTLDLRVDADLPEVDAVRGELNQVWLNLIDNAIDAAPASGHVVVSATHGRDCVAVSVVDDGPGIPEGVRDRIFEPFFTTKAVDEGTGLGLDIALGIVHRHNGSIEVSSVPGRTEFRVSLPRTGSGQAA